MRDYKKYAQDLRRIAQFQNCFECYEGERTEGSCSSRCTLNKAADAIEELLRIGAKMHTWIFLHTTDEQAAYDEIGLTEEQNALFGYSGQMILKAESPKDDAG